MCHLRSVIDFTYCCTVVVFDADVRMKERRIFGVRILELFDLVLTKTDVSGSQGEILSM